MKTVTYISKCVGIFPQSLPNKELIGSRATNEIVTLPFTYSCSGFREAIYHEKSAGLWLFGELDEVVKKFTSETESPMFGGFLGGVLNNVIGSPTGALKNLTANAAKLGGITGDLQNFAKTTTSTIKAFTNSDGFSKFLKVNK
jgi:hypothetical protein